MATVGFGMGEEVRLRTFGSKDWGLGFRVQSLGLRDHVLCSGYGGVKDSALRLAFRVQLNCTGYAK